MWKLRFRRKRYVIVPVTLISEQSPRSMVALWASTHRPAPVLVRTYCKLQLLLNYSKFRTSELVKQFYPLVYSQSFCVFDFRKFTRIPIRNQTWNREILKFSEFSSLFLAFRSRISSFRGGKGRNRGIFRNKVQSPCVTFVLKESNVYDFALLCCLW